MKLGVYSFEKIGLFIDGANLYSAAKSLGFDIDYKKLLELFREEGRLLRAFYYTALFEDQEYSPIRPLVDWLDYNGYTMVTKPAKEYTDSQGRRKVKGNMDMELAIDMLEMTEHLDHVILFSGDGDFRSLVEAVQRKGVRVSIVSTIKTSPPMIADELRRQADHFIELRDLADLIARHFHNQPRPNARPAPSRPSPEPEDEFEDDYDDEEDDYDDEDYDDEDYDDDDEDVVVERTGPKS
ncbi:MAG: NYN domain-containing protein [Marivibrio sp.]|uniref:LabA-like NYN domain-containing protein n=1 Tax=Marivibrio sp. TaxID=2039719 RepID=UPI0032ECACE8